MQAPHSSSKSTQEQNKAGEFARAAAVNLALPWSRENWHNACSLSPLVHGTTPTEVWKIDQERDRNFVNLGQISSSLHDSLRGLLV